MQIAAVGTIPAGQTLKMHIILDLPGANSGDTVVNGLSQGELESYARSSIVLRTLEGLCWHDDNADGVQNDSESRLSGIKVTLLKLKDGGDYTKFEDYEPSHYGGESSNAVVTIETGKQVSVRDGIITDYTDPSDSSRSEGCYKFTELPEGTFAVKFEDGTHTMSKYIASPVDMGGNDQLDSDGIAVYNADRTRIQYTYILNVEMPATADMKVALYESRYHDSGFYDRGPELPTTGGKGTKLYIIGGLLLTAAAVISLLYKRRRHGREDSLLF